MLRVLFVVQLVVAAAAMVVVGVQRQSTLDHKNRRRAIALTRPAMASILPVSTDGLRVVPFDAPPLALEVPIKETQVTEPPVVRIPAKQVPAKTEKIASARAAEPMPLALEEQVVPDEPAESLAWPTEPQLRLLEELVVERLVAVESPPPSQLPEQETNELVQAADFDPILEFFPPSDDSGQGNSALIRVVQQSPEGRFGGIVLRNSWSFDEFSSDQDNNPPSGGLSVYFVGGPAGDGGAGDAGSSAGSQELTASGASLFVGACV